MSVVWIALALGLVILSALGEMFRRSARARGPDLGSVSNQWVAEYRAQTQNTTR